MGGYINNEVYLANFYNVMSMPNFRIKCLLNGYMPPDIHTACELGFGHGNSLNIFASSSDVKWWGTDFNTSQAFYAQSFSKSVGNSAKLFADSFAQFSERDLPQFDYITLHGIYSWVDSEVRQNILEIIQKFLAPGGGLYISYNTKPGFSTAYPLRDFMWEYRQHLATHSTSAKDVVTQSFELLDQLSSMGALFIQDNPSLSKVFEEFKQKDPTYVAHEFLNQEWRPFSIFEIADQLEPMGMQFLGSGWQNPFLDHLIWNEEQRKLLSTYPLLVREFLKDHLLNNRFRSDFWLKGGIQLPERKQIELLCQQKVALVIRPENLTYQFMLKGREVQLNEALFKPIFEVLTQYPAIDIGELVERAHLAYSDILAVFSPLLQGGYIKPVSDPSNEVLERAKRANSYILSQCADESKQNFLVSPYLNEGVSITRIAKIILWIIDQIGSEDVEELTDRVYQFLSDRDEHIVFSGQHLTGQKMRDHLRKEVDGTLEMLPIFKRIGVA